MERNLIFSQIYAFLTISLWSSAYVFTKVALLYFSFSSLAFLRCAVASACLGLILFLKRKSFPRASSFPYFFISGAAGFAMYTLAFNKGTESLNPTTSCIIISTSPIITAIFAQIFFREKLTYFKWIAIGVAFCGILIMTLYDGSVSVSYGIFWMLTAATLISIYNILQRSLSRKFEPLIITAYSFFAGTILLTPFSHEAFVQIIKASFPQFCLVIFLGMLPSAIAYLFWAKALSLSPDTSNVSNYMFLTPFLALLLEYVVTGTVPGLATFIGGGVIMVSLIIYLWVSRYV